jgi:hypothetical protein
MAGHSGVAADMQFLFFCFIERQDGSVAVDVNVWFTEWFVTAE